VPTTAETPAQGSWEILKTAKVGSFQGHKGGEFSKAISGEFFKAIDTTIDSVERPPMRH
jgi:hypothetical protein